MLAAGRHREAYGAVMIDRGGDHYDVIDSSERSRAKKGISCL